MSGVLVVGRPDTETGQICRELTHVGQITVAWHETADLLAAEALWDNDISALLVPVDDDATATAAVAHRLQLYGPPLVVVLVTGASDDAALTERVIAVATQVARRVPTTRYVAAGPGAQMLRDRWAESLGPLVDGDPLCPEPSERADLVGRLVADQQTIFNQAIGA